MRSSHVSPGFTCELAWTYLQSGPTWQSPEIYITRVHEVRVHSARKYQTYMQIPLLSQEITGGSIRPESYWRPLHVSPGLTGGVVDVSPKLICRSLM